MLYTVKCIQIHNSHVGKNQLKIEVKNLRYAILSFYQLCQSQ